MSDLFWLTDEQIERLRPFFPKSHGRPRVDDRRVLSGIVFVNRNGLRWRDAPSEYGPHKTLYNRWKRWGERSRRRDHPRIAGARRPQATAVRAVPTASAARWPSAAGTARRPVSSQPSTMRENGSPPRWRASSIDQRGRPTPATSRRPEGALAIRQRVQAADGSSNGSWSRVRRRRRRSTGISASAARS